LVLGELVGEPGVLGLVAHQRVGGIVHLREERGDSVRRSILAGRDGLALLGVIEVAVGAKTLEEPQVAGQLVQRLGGTRALVRIDQ